MPPEQISVLKLKFNMLEIVYLSISVCIVKVRK